MDNGSGISDGARIERVQHIDSDANSRGGTSLTISSQTMNSNSIYGTVGMLINNNIVTTIIHEDLPKESVSSLTQYYRAALTSLQDTIQTKVSTALESRCVIRAVYGAQIEKGCMKDTRVQVLLEIEAWIKDMKGPQIFWLAGMAGTGKSAIAWTVCSRASKDSNTILAGSFFCSRSTGVTGQRDVRCVVPTLAQLLALQSAKFAKALAVELVANPGVLDLQMGMQVEMLLYKPLLALKDSPIPIVFVIDALDECGSKLTDDGTLDDAETHRVVSDMLEALVAFSTSEVKLPVKFFVTSRPETHIRDTPVSDGTFSKVLRLHNVDRQQINTDIRLYISNKLFATPILRVLFTEADVDTLTRFSDGLFIVAAVALEHALGSGPDVAAARFKSLLDVSRDQLSSGAAARLDRMYAVIVEDAAQDDEIATDKLATLLKVLAVLLSARMTLSVAAIADLLNLPSGQLRASITRLHAVVHVPDDDDDSSLRPIHASFGDYLFGRASDRIRLPKSLGHDALAHGCLHILAKRLHFNVSCSQSSFESNSAVRPNTITLSLEYACVQWIYHVSALSEPSSTDRSISSIAYSWLLSWVYPESQTANRPTLDDKISAIFRPRLLFWLEVMSSLGQVQRAAAMLMFAAATIRTKELAQFLRDANSFVASSQEAISRSAPHIYLSALPFADKDSLVYQDFAPLCPSPISVNLDNISHHAGRLMMTLIGHEGAVNSVAYAPGSLRLASASADGTVRIWDMRTGQESMTPLRSGDGEVLSIAFAPDGKHFVSGTETGIVCVWGLTAAHMSAEKLRGHSAAVSSVSLSPDGSYIASASFDSTACLWNVETKQQIMVLRRHSDMAHALAFSSDSLTLITGSADQTIRIWDVLTGSLRSESPFRLKERVYSLCFLADGRIVAGCEKSLILCKYKAGRSKTWLHRAYDPIMSVSPSPDGLSVVSVNGTNLCLSNLLESVAKRSTVVLGGHTDTIRSVVFSPNDLYIATSSNDRTIRIWNASGKVEALSTKAHVMDEVESAPSTFNSLQLKGHMKFVASVAVSPNGAFLVSGGGDMSVRIWDPQTGAAIFPPLFGHTASVYAVAISSDGLLIASASADRTVRLWDAQTGTAVGGPLQGHSGAARAVAFSPNAQLLASGSADTTLHIWEVATRQSSTAGPLRCYDGVNAVVFSPDGLLIAAGDRSGYISIWRSENGQQTRRLLQTSLVRVYSICFSPDGARIVAGGERKASGHVQILNVSTGEQVLDLTGHTDDVMSVAYSPDGRVIGTGSEDRTVRLWDAATGKSIVVAREHSNFVRSVAFTPDGQSIVSGSFDMTIRVWRFVHPAWERSVNDNNRNTVLDSAALCNGWLRGTSGKLLLWVPADYRQHLYRLTGTPHHLVIDVGKNEWHCGESWTSCWRTDTSYPTVFPVERSL